MRLIVHVFFAFRLLCILPVCFVAFRPLIYFVLIYKKNKNLWSEVHWKKIMEQWGRVTEINWKMLKLFDLSKARVRVVMKERSVLPALD